MDEIGVPFALTVDFNTVGYEGYDKDGCVTLRERDSQQQDFALRRRRRRRCIRCRSKTADPEQSAHHPGSPPLAFSNAGRKKTMPTPSFAIAIFAVAPEAHDLRQAPE